MAGRSRFCPIDTIYGAYKSQLNTERRDHNEGATLKLRE